MKKFFYFLILIFVITGCSALEAFSVPKGTSAGFAVKSDILWLIDIRQRAYMPNCNYKIIKTEVIEKKGKSTFEEWTVESCGEKIIYSVELQKAALGRTTYTVHRK